MQNAGNFANLLAECEAETWQPGAECSQVQQPRTFGGGERDGDDRMMIQFPRLLES